MRYDHYMKKTESKTEIEFRCPSRNLENEKDYHKKIEGYNKFAFREKLPTR